MVSFFRGYEMFQTWNLWINSEFKDAEKAKTIATLQNLHADGHPGPKHMEVIRMTNVEVLKDFEGVRGYYLDKLVELMRFSSRTVPTVCNPELTAQFINNYEKLKRDVK